VCGICGIYASLGAADGQTVRRMSDVLAHRGPDDSDTWADPDAGIALGHRRLSILDTSALGRQPMHSACKRFVLAYNGEIYNHLEIRRALPEHPFRSTSDTETILAAVAAWGLETALARFAGMFALALWDRRERRLFLVRDRIGIKPLYYGRIKEGWVFGSELKALRAHPGFAPDIDRRALALFFRHNFIPAPYSIYTNAWKLCPGQMAVFDDEGLRLQTWWDAAAVWREGVEAPFVDGQKDLEDRLDELLSIVTAEHMISDVQIGAFLSGGIDSSTVVSFMQKKSSKPIKTFSIGFNEGSYNEANYANAVATHLKTEHTELYVTQKEMLDVIPLMPEFWDEPFADSSQIPTYILSLLTRRQVTVSLSGDGGDELFCGYQRYFWMNRWDKVARIPWRIRTLAAVVLKRLPARIFDVLGPLGQKIRWRLDILGMRDFAEFYRYFMSHFKRPAEFVPGGEEPETPLTNARNRIMGDRYAQMALWDIVNYLPGDILTKVDRASMAVSLEARVPLLDHRVVEFAARVPTAWKVRHDQGKWLLRQVLYRYVPQALVERPKMGFGIPLGEWLRGDLREWCEDLLSPAMIRRQGCLDAATVSRMWREYLAGESNWSPYLWDVLMFQAWHERWVKA